MRNTTFVSCKQDSLDLKWKCYHIGTWYGFQQANIYRTFFFIIKNAQFVSNGRARQYLLLVRERGSQSPEEKGSHSEGSFNSVTPVGLVLKLLSPASCWEDLRKKSFDCDVSMLLIILRMDSLRGRVFLLPVAKLTKVQCYSTYIEVQAVTSHLLFSRLWNAFSQPCSLTKFSLEHKFIILSETKYHFFLGPLRF